jgi:hypothetical protein
MRVIRMAASSSEAYPMVRFLLAPLRCTARGMLGDALGGRVGVERSRKTRALAPAVSLPVKREPPREDSSRGLAGFSARGTRLLKSELKKRA